jgi:hypothetical protein
VLTRLVAVLAAVLIAVLGVAAGGHVAVATTPPADDGGMLTLPPDGTEQPDTTNDFLDLERDYTECVGTNPKPGCGRDPVRSGDRGGWMQWTVFAVMIGAIGFIGWRIVAGGRRARAQRS